jgi:hypothetical protein
MAFEDFQGFTEELKEWPNLYEEVEPGLLWGIGIGASLYFETPDADAVLQHRKIVIDIAERYRSITDGRLQYAVHPGTELLHPVSSKNLPDLKLLAETHPIDTAFAVAFSDQGNRASSPEIGFTSLVNQYWDERPDSFERSYSYLRFDFTLPWWQKNKSALMDLYLHAADSLNAEQGYIGFSWALPTDIGAQAAYEEREFELSKLFYGLDVEKPFWMTGSHADSKSLIHGLRSPSWMTWVGSRFLEKLGGASALRSHLESEEINILSRGNGVLIRAGKDPQLFPVEDGLPVAMMNIARILKPVRVHTLKLTGFLRYDDDPAVTFDLNTAAQWLARFDDDGMWPSPEVRFVAPDAGPVANSGSIESKSFEHRAIDNDLLVAHNGQACPKSGTWGLKDRLDVKRTFELGDILPSFDNREAVWVFLSQ